MGTKLWKVGHFNPLPRKEGDHRSQRVPCPVGDFNPLPRKEGDLNLFWMPDDTLISIHSLVKRETSGKSVTDVSHYDFNPLPRKEGDHDYQKYAVRFIISIHSLVKRETQYALKSLITMHISIHSLVKRETISRCNASYCSGISIHSLVKRETLKNPSRLLISQSISIHSLVKRETAAINMVFPDFLDFNPLPRKEGDRQTAMSLNQVLLFQSTPS